jgi:dTDP-4-amino-4,6-dideoxygalactose transaminase
MKKIRNIIGKKILVSDLRKEDRAIRRKVENAVKRVLSSGWYVLGQELEKFEKEFASYCGSKYAIGVASGTDALILSLKALSIGRNDEVITAVNTAIPTAMAIMSTGARPVFVDVREDTFNIDTEKIEKVITKRTKAIIPVHLYGNPCDIDKIMKIARKYGLFVIEDACQAHGASRSGKKTGTFGDIAAFSFYPTKNLGCYGDGGMIVTASGNLARKLKLLRNYGQSTRYLCETEGVNSRLDEIQAAVLRVKLKYLDSFNDRRGEIAALYTRHLEELDEINIPAVRDGSRHVFHLYVIECERREPLMNYLSNMSIETQVHYPVSLHLQKAFRHLGYAKGDFPVAERAACRILSLPVFPALRDSEVLKICSCIKNFYRR